jgi:hypothetical protein
MKFKLSKSEMVNFCIVESRCVVCFGTPPKSYAPIYRPFIFLLYVLRNKMLLIAFSWRRE